MEQHDQPYLEDVVLKEGRKHPLSWDLDREFGLGVFTEVRKEMARVIEEENSSTPSMIDWAAELAILDPAHPSVQRGWEAARQLVQQISEVRLPDIAANMKILGVQLSLPSIEKEETVTRAKKELEQAVREKSTGSIAARLFTLRILQPEVALDAALRKRAVQHLISQVRRYLEEKNYSDAGWQAAELRVLRADAIRFHPIGGIEIDDQPGEFEKEKSEPLPETRNF